MNHKRAALIQLAKDSYFVVPVERFFDGNPNDFGSIGCNLTNHPGIPAFRDALVGLQRRSDVDGVFAMIGDTNEHDPDETTWPYTGTILVVGTISPDDLATALRHLQFSEVGSGEGYGAPAEFLATCTSPVHAVWWD